jgi:tRNA(fMet)-specific endonuclease VapC
MSRHKLLLDTSAVIGAFADEARVTAILRATVNWYLPTIAYGELIYGAHASARVRQNLDRIGEFASICNVLLIDFETAQHYGRIKTELRFAGKPIPDNDAWIAALARQHGLPLLSQDAHFGNVENLDLVRW